MKITRGRIVQACVVAALVAGAVWFARSIEWTDVDVQTFSRNEAARDRFYAAKSLVHGLDGRTVTGRNLDTLPPTTATLVLSSSHWNMFPGRDAALRHWVEGGGRLVLIDMDVMRDQAVPGWTSLRAVHQSASCASAASAAASASSDAAAASASAASPTPCASAASAPRTKAKNPLSDMALRLKARPCAVLTEPETVRPMFAKARSYRVCGYPSTHLRSKAPALWALDDADGMRMERVAVGRGSVALSVVYDAFTNENFIRDDGPLAFAALLDLHGGDEVWFVEDESRAPFFRALWDHGKAAVLLGLLALGLALWRGIPRFGPLAAEPSAARRSIGEQIRRTAAFIAAGPGDALHRAALNALDAAASRTVADYASFQSPASRAQAIAARIRTDAAALEEAMRRPEKRRLLAGAIAQIERARRALLESPAGTRPRHEQPRPTTP